jgi:hypothetical protein
VARNIDNGELLALVQSKYNVSDQDVKHEILHALGIYNKTPTMGIFENFTVAEWNTWSAFELVPIFDIFIARTNGLGRGLLWDAKQVKP